MSTTHSDASKLFPRGGWRGLWAKLLPGLFPPPVVPEHVISPHTPRVGTRYDFRGYLQHNAGPAPVGAENASPLHGGWPGDPVAFSQLTPEQQADQQRMDAVRSAPPGRQQPRLTLREQQAAYNAKWGNHGAIESVATPEEDLVPHPVIVRGPAK